MTIHDLAIATCRQLRANAIRRRAPHHIVAFNYRPAAEDVKVMEDALHRAVGLAIKKELADKQNRAEGPFQLNDSRVASGEGQSKRG